MTATATRLRMRTTTRLLLALVALAASVGVLVDTTPASAARWIAGPAWFQCHGGGKLSVSPPRIWATRGTEQVVWGNNVERWNGYRWLKYRNFQNWASFNYYGQGVTYWIGNPPIPWGSFVNNRLWLQVYHPGYYRIAAGVVGNQGGQQWFGYVGNGAYCYVP